MQYLTDWRMTLARDYLRAGELGLANIAGIVGYGSPYAFATAFRRHHGDPRARGVAAAGVGPRRRGPGERAPPGGPEPVLVMTESCFRAGGGVSGSVPRAAPGVPRRVCREAAGGAARDLGSTKTGGLTRAVAQASESIQRSRRRASRTISSGWRNVFVISMIPW